MSPTRRILRFMLLSGGVYLVLMAPWIHLDRVYAPVFRGLGTLSVQVLGLGNRVFFEPLTNPGVQSRDSIIRLTSPGVVNEQGQLVSLPIPLTTRYLCAAPLVLFLALILATPVTWRRRTRAMALGGAILLVFVGIRVALMVLTVLIQRDGVGLYLQHPVWGWFVEVLGLTSNSPALKRVSAYLADLFCGASMTSLLVPILVWVAVTFDRGDWKRLLNVVPTR